MGVYTLSPLRISTPISPPPIPGVGSSRRGIRVHGPRLKHLYNYCWRDSIDGKAVFFICRCIREQDHGRSRGEAIGIKSAAGLDCLFIVHDDVVVFVDIVRPKSEISRNIELWWQQEIWMENYKVASNERAYPFGSPVSSRPSFQSPMK